MLFLFFLHTLIRNTSPLPSPSSKINIYYNETLGEQVCTCCRTCEGWRLCLAPRFWLVSAYADAIPCKAWLSYIYFTFFVSTPPACVGGNGGTSRLRYNSKTNHSIFGVKPGERVHYAAHLKNVGKSTPAPGLVLTVQLPAGVTYVKSRGPSAFVVYETKRGMSLYRKWEHLEAQSNSTLNTVTWTDILLPPRRSVKVQIEVRVQPDERRDTSLIFTGSFYQQSPVNGLPYCASGDVEDLVVV